MESTDDVLMACTVGDLPWLKRGLRRGIHPGRKNRQGMNGLHLAAKHGKLDCMKHLLDNCDLSVNEPALSTGNTPLHYCITGAKSIRCMKLLLDRGADENSSNNEGQTTLHIAARLGHVKSLRTMLERGADIHLTDRDGNTAHNLACLHGQHECARLLQALHWASNKDASLNEKFTRETATQNMEREMKAVNARIKKEAAEIAYGNWMEKNAFPHYSVQSPTACEQRGHVRSKPNRVSTCDTCSQAASHFQSAISSRSKPKNPVPIKMSLTQAERNVGLVGKPEKLYPYTNYPPHSLRNQNSSSETRTKPKSAVSSRTPSHIGKRSNVTTPAPVGVQHYGHKIHQEREAESTTSSPTPPPPPVCGPSPPSCSGNSDRIGFASLSTMPEILAKRDPVPAGADTLYDPEELQKGAEHGDIPEIAWIIGSPDEQLEMEQELQEDSDNAAVQHPFTAALSGSANEEGEDEYEEEWEEEDLGLFHDVGHTNSLDALSLPSALVKGGRTPAEVVQLLRCLGNSGQSSRNLHRSYSHGSHSRASFFRNRFQRRFSLGAIPEGKMVTSYSDEDASTSHLIDGQFVTYSYPGSHDRGSRTNSWKEELEKNREELEDTELQTLVLSDNSDEEVCLEEEAEDVRENIQKFSHPNFRLKLSKSDTMLLGSSQPAEPLRLSFLTAPPTRKTSPCSPSSLKVVNFAWDSQSNSVYSQVTESPLPDHSERTRKEVTPPSSGRSPRQNFDSLSPLNTSRTSSPYSRSESPRSISPSNSGQCGRVSPSFNGPTLPPQPSMTIGGRNSPRPTHPESLLSPSNHRPKPPVSLPANSLFALSPLASKSTRSFQNVQIEQENNASDTELARRTKSAPNLRANHRHSHVLKTAVFEFGATLRHS